ncbi:hypothetical protein WJX72_011555 [[Myrmecia] bisecta]|uniref:Ribosomal eL28/Mak16 domain-containing protein n=1 Tax=[Myrmecia] bisecta TaxID=41462 RepID=A0AAW1R9C6_9CHLO
MSSQLVWQLVKNYNSFMVKGLNGSTFSTEPGNLFNKHSYKYSGLANEKTVHIEAGDDMAVTVTKSRTKNAQKPAAARHSTTSKKHVRRQATSLGKEVQHFRPDLKAAALARLSAVNKSQRTKRGSKAAKSS